MKRFFFLLLILILLPVSGWGATYYVTVDPGQGGGNGSKICYSTTSFAAACTDNANKTWTNLNTAASAGDTINWQTGTYILSIVITKNYTVQASGGTVTLNTTDVTGFDIDSPGTGTLTINGPINHTQISTGANNFNAIDFGANANAIITDYHLLKCRNTTLNAITVANGTSAIKFVKSSFKDTWSNNGAGLSKLFYAAGAASVEFDYCLFEYGAGKITLDNVTTSILNNNVFAWGGAKPGGAELYCIDLNNNGKTLTSKNNLYMGCVPVNDGSVSPTIVSNNDYWHQSSYSLIMKTTFNFRGAANLNATISNSINYQLPYFVSLAGSNLKTFLIAIDDSDNLIEAYNFALNYATPNGLKIDLAMNGPEYSTLTPWTNDTINQLRYLVNNGHAVSAHGSHHTSFTSLNAITWSATGAAVKSITVTGTRTGDSSTWTGNLKLTYDGVDCPDATGIDLANASYDTLGEVITWINNRVCNGSTFTASKTTASHNTGTKSLVLADAAAQTTTPLLFNEAALIRAEATENILDLEAYINGTTGTALRPCDRNGNVCIGSDATTAVPSPVYDCVTWRSPNSLGSPALATELKNNQGIIAGVYTDVSSTAACYNLIGSYDSTDNVCNLYQIIYDQIDSDNRLFADVVVSTLGPTIWAVLWHGTPTYGGTEQGLVDLLRHFGNGTTTLKDLATTITTSGDWTQTGAGTGIWYFSGTLSDYVGSNDYRLKSSSPLIGAGTNICTGVDTPLTGCTGAGTGSYTDHVGFIVPFGAAPDIGAYEFGISILIEEYYRDFLGGP